MKLMIIKIMCGVTRWSALSVTRVLVKGTQIDIDGSGGGGKGL